MWLACLWGSSSGLHWTQENKRVAPHFKNDPTQRGYWDPLQCSSSSQSGVLLLCLRATCHTSTAVPVVDEGAWHSLWTAPAAQTVPTGEEDTGRTEEHPVLKPGVKTNSFFPTNFFLTSKYSSVLTALDDYLEHLPFRSCLFHVTRCRKLKFWFHVQRFVLSQTR